mmetsp:Transcript_7070/g.16170  ORF Transcript_7070/g.16170 Transcript_7070/m.16170 type:complete len:82 (-) Transcript_7070:238-483(-)
MQGKSNIRNLWLYTTKAGLGSAQQTSGVSVQSSVRILGHLFHCLQEYARSEMDIKFSNIPSHDATQMYTSRGSVSRNTSAI